MAENFENELGVVSSIDGNDTVRVVTEEGNSRRVTGSDLKSYVGGGTAIEFIEVTGSGDDAGLICTGQWSVGTVDEPKESVFGGGDSYPAGDNGSITFHADIANTTGLTVTGATDVTEILGSDDLSTTGFFGGTTDGKYLLVGSDYKFGGAKVKIDTKGVITTDDVVPEYMPVSGTWYPISIMATQANYPYNQLNRAAGVTEDDTSEQWRFGFNPLVLPVPWEMATMNINGTDYTKYWGRIRLDAAITTDIVVQQVKMHTNRCEINNDGIMELFGRSRSPRDLNMSWGSTIHLDPYSPANEDITFANGIKLNYTDNEFANGTTDGRGGNIIIPQGLDTSIPLVFEFTWTPLNDAAGDVVYDIETIQKKIGDTLDDSENPVSHQGAETVAANSDNVLHKTQILIDVEKLGVGEMLAFGFKRLGADGADTYGGNVGMVNVRVVGHFWKV